MDDFRVGLKFDVMTPLSANAPVLWTEPRFFLIEPKSTEGVDDFFALKDELKEALKVDEDANEEAMEDVEWADRRSAPNAVGVVDSDRDNSKPEVGVDSPEYGVAFGGDKSSSSDDRLDGVKAEAIGDVEDSAAAVCCQSEMDV